MSFLRDLFESTFPVAFADEPTTHEECEEGSSCHQVEEQEVSEDAENDEEEDEDEEEDDEDEDEESVKDPLDEMREECEKSEGCHKYVHHFQECVERVQKEQEEEGYAQKAYKEDCVEEFFHLQHCINDCVAPKLFYKLK